VARVETSGRAGEGVWAALGAGESKSSGGVPKEAKGKDDSSKTTCRETNMRFMLRSRHRYPLCLEEYPKMTHRQERGASLWEAVPEVFG
jgi:hypothetical protein